MTAPLPTQAPILSTPESNIFEDPTPPSKSANEPRLTREEIWDVYEIERTAREVVEGRYRRVGLQFPDGMLRDATVVFEALDAEIQRLPAVTKKTEGVAEGLETEIGGLEIVEGGGENVGGKEEERVRLYILADTSYGSCCVDEVAAEHVDADVVVHYGRSCLSPTARLPVIYVFTTRPLDIEQVIATFEATFPGKDENVVLVADVVYHSHMKKLHTELKERGYIGVVGTELVHDPEGIIPNRKLPEEITKDILKTYKLFHISDPPTALLLTLNSRVQEMFIYPTKTPKENGKALEPTKTYTTRLLRRRYAHLTSLSTNPIFGILINTLSIKSFLPAVSAIQSLISLSGKKSYTFVVGKVNAAKIANFSEIGGWVVVGCWESSLVENEDGGFYKPLVTPMELGLCLLGDAERVWDGGWEGGFGGVEEMVRLKQEQVKVEAEVAKRKILENGENGGETHEEEDSEEDSAPPEFDLRTGRYVTHSRPMRTTTHHSSQDAASEPPNANGNAESSETSKVLTRRAKGDLIMVGNEVSPGAEYLRSQRTWTGLGSDFERQDEEGEVGLNVEEGRGGVARGYRVGGVGERR